MAKSQWCFIILNIEGREKIIRVTLLCLIIFFGNCLYHIKGWGFNGLYRWPCPFSSPLPVCVALFLLLRTLRPFRNQDGRHLAMATAFLFPWQPPQVRTIMNKINNTSKQSWFYMTYKNRHLNYIYFLFVYQTFSRQFWIQHVLFWLVPWYSEEREQSLWGRGFWGTRKTKPEIGIVI